MSIGEKVLGWFVVPEEEAPAAPAPAAPAPAAKTPAPKPAPVAHAAIPDDARATLGRVLTLLASLPHEAPDDMKRAVVKASLDAFGVKIEGVVAAGTAAMDALEAHSETAKQRHEKAIVAATEHIAKLETEIASARQLIANERARHVEEERAIESEKAGLRGALDFFREPAAPRLVRLK